VEAEEDLENTLEIRRQENRRFAAIRAIADFERSDLSSRFIHFSAEELEQQATRLRNQYPEYASRIDRILQTHMYRIAEYQNEAIRRIYRKRKLLRRTRLPSSLSKYINDPRTLNRLQTIRERNRSIRTQEL
jgi:hypothetical protein